MKGSLDSNAITYIIPYKYHIFLQLYSFAVTFVSEKHSISYLNAYIHNLIKITDMKTRNFWILGVVLAVFASAANAQSFGSKSDTVSYPLGDSLTNGNNSLQDFGPINTGQTQCHTIFLKNSGSDPLIIQTVSLFSYNGNYGDFNVKPIPTLPTILLHNEIVSIADLCYAPTNPNVTSEKGSKIGRASCRERV